MKSKPRGRADINNVLFDKHVRFASSFLDISLENTRLIGRADIRVPIYGRIKNEVLTSPIH